MDINPKNEISLPTAMHVIIPIPGVNDKWYAPL